MGFKEKNVVVRYVTGQPLLCERAFDNAKDAEEFAKNIAESGIIKMRVHDITIAEMEESYEDVSFKPDAVDLGTLNPIPDDTMPPGRAGRAAQSEDQKRESQVSRVTNTGPSDEKRGPQVVTKTTTPTTAKEDSRGTESRATVDQKGQTLPGRPVNVEASRANAPKPGDAPKPQAASQKQESSRPKN